MAKLASNKVSELPLLIKADVQGSAEAIVGSLEKFATDEVRARIILSGAGGHQRERCHAGQGRRRPHSRLQRPRLQARRELAEHEGVEIATTRSSTTFSTTSKASSRACSPDPAGDLPRIGRGPAGLRYLQGRQDRRLPGDRGRRAQGRARFESFARTSWCWSWAPFRL